MLAENVSLACLTIRWFLASQELQNYTVPLQLVDFAFFMHVFVFREVLRGRPMQIVRAVSCLAKISSM